LDAKGQITLNVFMFAIAGAIMFIVFMSIFNAFTTLESSTVNGIANEATIDLMWGLIPVIIIVGLIVGALGYSMFNAQQSQY